MTEQPLAPPTAVEACIAACVNASVNLGHLTEAFGLDVVRDHLGRWIELGESLPDSGVWQPPSTIRRMLAEIEGREW